MPALTTAEREFLANQWRFLEGTDATVKTVHPGAREIEMPTPFITLAGVTAAMDIIYEQLVGAKRLVVATIDVAIPISFKGRPPTVRLHNARFGGDLVNGILMLCERADIDRGAGRTTLYLSGDQ